MQRWFRFSGVLALVLLLFGIGGGFIGGSFGQPLIIVHLALGGILLLVWLATSGAKNLGAAGEVVVGRTARFSFNALLYTLVFVGLLSALNWFGARHAKKWDLTEQGVFSLASQSSKLMEELKKPLKLVAFKGSEWVNEEQLKELFDMYRYHNPGKVSTELIDPRSKPHMVDAYEMKPGNIIYIEYGEGEGKAVSRINEASEEAVTNAVLKLSRGEAKKIYYVLGHDEPSIKDATPAGLNQFAAALADEHLTLETIFLAEKESVPDDAVAVILVNPRSPMLQGEIDLLIKYAEQGGRLLLMSDVRGGEDVGKIATHFGIEVGSNMVVDLVQRLFAAPALGAKVISRTYSPHAITRNMGEETVTIFDMARTVVAANKSPAPEQGTYTELVKSGPSAWAETDLAMIFDSEQPSAAFDQGKDMMGPVSLALAYEKKLTPTEDKGEESQEAKFDKVMRLVVFGDSNWIANENFALYGNRDLLLNSINWLSGEEGGISIRPKSLRESIAPITRDSFLIILVSSFLIPELILIFGLIVWWRRKTVTA